MPIHLQKSYSPRKRMLLKLTILLILILLLGTVATVPFIYESQSLWYKFGMSKVILRIGKIAGLFAAVFLFFQILLAIRLPVFDKIFGLDRVFFIHRINALVILSLAILHASLVIVPEGLNNLPIGRKYWPEMVGATMLFSLMIITLSALFRSRLLPYHRWRSLHRPLGCLLFFGVALHILFVSDSFEQSVPKLTLLVLIGTVLLCVMMVKYRYHMQAQKKWQVEKVQPLNDKVVSIIIRPLSPFSYTPGQFAFLTFSGPGGLNEPHPFTIASSPTDGETLRFIIKKGGKWTERLEKIAREKASLQGPFGLFSYQVKEKVQQMVFIAAGIGITPMLSMLNHIATEKQQPKVTLIWTIRREKDMFLRKELEKLKSKISLLDIHLIYTQTNGGGRLNKKRLAQILKPCDAFCHIYLCGPPQMMEETRNSLVFLGFRRKNIFWERFSL
jgi:predicted ferric reductase